MQQHACCNVCVGSCLVLSGQLNDLYSNEGIQLNSNDLGFTVTFRCPWGQLRGHWRCSSVVPAEEWNLGCCCTEKGHKHFNHFVEGSAFWWSDWEVCVTAHDSAFVTVRVFGMELNLSCLPVVMGFGGEDFGVLELHIMLLYEALLSQSQVIWQCKTDVMVVFFRHGLSRQAGLSSVHLSTLTSDALTRSGSTVLNKGNEAEDLGWQANTFNAISQQHSADVIEGHVDL